MKWVILALLTTILLTIMGVYIAPAGGFGPYTDAEATLLQQVVAKTVANFICGALVLAIFAIYLIGTTIRKR